jgi:hypothetical protein
MGVGEKRRRGPAARLGSGSGVDQSIEERHHGRPSFLQVNAL